jgi:hypothetical protein
MDIPVRPPMNTTAHIEASTIAFPAGPLHGTRMVGLVHRAAEMAAPFAEVPGKRRQRGKGEKPEEQ